MKHDQHLHTLAEALVRQCSSPTPAEPIEPLAKRVPPQSYEPACLMSWATSVAAMDETIGGVLDETVVGA